MIESVSLGKLLYKGKVSRSDTIVHSDRMNTKWWIKNRTCIEISDLEEVFSVDPEVVVVGLGFMFPITISDSAVDEMKSRGIEVFVSKTDAAVGMFNN